MRVLFGAAPSYGHIVPMLPLARAMRAAGHDVVVATNDEIHPVVEAAGLQAASAGMSDAAMLERRRERWPESEHEPVAAWAVRMFARIAAPAMLADLRPLVDAWRPDLVVHDEGEYASPVAAAAAGVPWVTHGWGSPLRLPLDLAPLGADTEGLWRSQDLPQPPLSGLYHHAVVDPCPPSLQPGVGAVPRRLPVRFEPYEPSSTTSSASPIGNRRPLAYVGFGTAPLYRDPSELLLAVARGLLQEGFDVVATVEDRDLGERLVGLSPENVHVRRFVSLGTVLAHCSLTVCHGGAGTTLAALHNGLPVLLVPRGSPSQTRMALACAAAGVGRVLQPAQATAAAVGAEIRALARDQCMERAAAVASEMAELPPASALVAPLEALAGA
jgi:UDP:flavonoid glycosyltransferase YjiC (YdhE family)